MQKIRLNNNKINNFEITPRICKKSDKKFILNLYEYSIFKYVSEYYKPDLKIFNERFETDYKQKIILLRGKRRIGMYQLFLDKNVLIIKGLFIKYNYQGLGIGKYLIKYFENYAKENNCLKMRLSVWDNNPAVYFYKKHGFKILSSNNNKHSMCKFIT